MRALFLLLLLVNVLFLAWTRWVDVSPAPAPSFSAGTQPGATPIRLRQEVAADAPAARKAPVSDALLAATCVSVGPFVAGAAAEAAAARLGQLGFVARSRASVDEVRVGFWVRVPNLPTPDDAVNALGALQQAGFADAYIVNDGSPGNIVSLGVFSDRGKAEQVAETVRKAGFTPETSDRLRTMDVSWLDIDRQENGSLPALEAIEAGPPDSPPITLEACPNTTDPGAEPSAASGAQPAG